MQDVGPDQQQEPLDRGDRAASKAGVSTTAFAIGLNVLLLAMLAYGYTQSKDLRWAWVLVAIPIAAVTVTYIRHWLRG